MSEEQLETHGSTVVTADPDAAPPRGEGIHLPGGSPIPLVIALGITVALIGTTLWWGWTIIGGIVFVGALAAWIRDTIHEVDHLPDDLAAGGGHH